jgi:transposase
MIAEDHSARKHEEIFWMPEVGNLLGESLEAFQVVEGQEKPERAKREPAKRLKPIDRSQSFWGAIDVEKLIEEDHPARGIWAMVTRLDLSPLEEKIKAVEGRAGQSSLDPRLLMALWIYGYSEAVSSARELSRLCGYEPGCQWLTGMQPVNYHTLSDFRVEHKKELDEIFVQVLGLLSAEGLVEMKRITQDGTKVKAQAGADSFRREQRIRQHLQLAREQVEAMGRPESEEESQRVSQARKRATRDRQQRLQEALHELEQIQKVRAESESDQVRVSETDPEARVMKHADGGFAPSYNVQISTDAAAGIIVGVDVTQAGNDCDQLLNGVDQVETNTGLTPEQILVDGGYTMKNSNIEVMAERGIDLNGPVVESNSEASLKQRGIQPEFYPSQFRFHETTDTMICPADKTLRRIGRHRREGRIEYSYQASATDCLACPFRVRCCPKSSPRRVVRLEHSEAVKAFRAKMQTEEAQQLYRTRAQIAEFPHAWIKEKLGLRRFRLRGRQKVRAEAVWACLTYNIQQWLRLVWRANLQAAA